MDEIQELERLEAEATKAKELFRNTFNKWAEKQCPFKVGDVIKVHGYSYKGKMGRVVRITGRRGWDNPWGWEVRVRVLNKSGKDSSNFADFTQGQYEDEISE